MNKYRLVISKKPPKKLKDWFNQTFLPVNYPKSVHSQYMQYTKYQFLHCTVGSACGVISTQAILMAMNLSSSIPLAATLNWIIKDGLGQMGGVAYVSKFGHLFDSNTKRYRFLACCSMQIACLLEIFTLKFPSCFLLIASISNIAKNVAWLANSATRAKIHSSFALQDNLADLTGKAGSQNTAAGVIGTGIGIAITTLMPTFPLMILAFVPLSCISLYANYQSTNSGISRVLNSQRLDLVLKENIYDIEYICGKEIFVKKYKEKYAIDPSIRSLSSDQMNQLLNPTFVERYSIVDGPLILFHESATTKDIIFGIIHCNIIVSSDKSILEAYKESLLVREGILLNLENNKWDLDQIYISEKRIKLEKVN